MPLTVHATPLLHATLLNVLIGAQSIILHVRRESGQQGAEVLFFNAQRQVIKGVAHWSAS